MSETDSIELQKPRLQTWELIYRGTWPNEYVQLLKKRNDEESKPFVDVFGSFSNLYSQLEQYRGKIKKLDYENMIRQEEIKSIANDPGKQFTDSEKRILALQEENISLIRQSEGNQRELLKMTQKVKELAKKEILIMNLEQKCYKVEQENDILKDELTTLQLMYRKSEDENKKLKGENNQMLEKILLQKKEEVDIINLKNETMKMIRDHQMFYELENARKEETSPDQSLDIIRSISELSLAFDRSAASGTATAAPTTSNSRPFGILSRMFRKSESEGEEADGGRGSSVSSMSRHRMYSGPSIIPANVVNKVDAHTSEIYSLAFSYQGTIFATGGADKTIKLWRTSNMPNIDPLSTLTGCNAGVMSIDIDERDQYLIGGSNDAAVRIWQITGGQIRATLMGHDNKILTVKFYGHSQRAVSGSHDRTLRLWDVRTSKNMRTIFARSSCNDLAVLSETGTNIVSGHFDKRLRFWDERQDTSSHEMLMDGRITSIDLSFCGKYLACSCKDTSAIKFIDLKLNQAIATFTADGLRIGEQTRCSFSPDGQYIAVGSSDGSIYVWNTRTLKREDVPRVHTSAVPAIRWHPFGQTFVSLEKSKRFYVWSNTEV